MRDDRERANETAIAILGCVLSRSADASGVVQAWIASIKVHQRRGQPLTVLEHTVAAYLVRSGFLDRFPISYSRGDIDGVLRTSWICLIGKPVEQITGRLPRSVLRRASREERLFHLAAFQAAGPKAAISQTSIGRDYVPQWCDLIAAAALAAVVATGEAASVLAGAAIGYAIATVAEYVMHRWAGHEAGGPLKSLLQKSGWMGAKASDYFAAVYHGHFVIHHVKTSNRNYTTQFAPAYPGEQSTIDAELNALGATGQHIKASDYGMTLTHGGVIAGLMATLPIYLTLIWALSLEFPSAVALVAPSLLYIGASKYLHPRLHQRRQKAMAMSGPLLRWLLRTRYAEWISRSHWIHHKGGGGNYNLVPGADILFGDLRKPNLNMVLRMRTDGIVGADWSDVPALDLRCTPARDAQSFGNSTGSA